MIDRSGNYRKRYLDHMKDGTRNSHVSYMALGIHHNKERSWETLFLTILKVGLRKTVGNIPKTEINYQAEIETFYC